MPNVMPIARLLAEIEENPIEGGKTAQKRYAGVRTANYESSVSAGALYRALKDAPSLVSAFYALPFWKGDDDKKAYKKNPKNLAKHCHQFVYGARDGSEGKRAEDHAFATQCYLDDESKSLEDLLEVLKEKGFDGLKPKKHAETRAQAKATEAETKRESFAGDTKFSGQDDSDASETASGTARKPPKPKYPKMTLKKVFEHLLVAMEPHELMKFLADQSKVGDAYHITVERDADGAKGMLVWRAVVIAKVLDEV